MKKKLILLSAVLLLFWGCKKRKDVIRPLVENNNLTWKEIQNQPVTNGGIVRMMQTASGKIFIIANIPFTTDSTFFSIDSGANWLPEDGLPTIDLTGPKQDPATGVLLASGSDKYLVGGDIFTSIDDGKTWNFNYYNGLAYWSIADFAFLNSKAYLVSYQENDSYSPGKKMQSSTNDFQSSPMFCPDIPLVNFADPSFQLYTFNNSIFLVESFQKINSWDYTSRIFRTSNPQSAEGWIKCDSVLSNSPSTSFPEIVNIVQKDNYLFACGGESILRSDNNGQNWSQVYSDDGVFAGMAINQNMLFALDPYNGIIGSNNNGANWQSFNNGLPAIDVRNNDEVNVILSLGDYLLAGTSKGKIYKLKLR
jgi:hypothetical protein